MEDNRFKHIATDPKFRRIPKSSQKVKIDKRFKSMFKDKKFKIKYTVDKRGRPVNHNSNEDLKRYYELSSDDTSSDDESENEMQQISRKKNKDKSGSIEDLPASPEKNDDELDGGSAGQKLTANTDDSKPISEVIKSKLKNLNIDYARGEVPLLSESSSDDEETEEELSESEQIEHKWGELDADANQTEEVTYRLAACNMDWDRIRAVDLMVLFNSFLPSGGLIKSVTIFPSEFGKQRIQEEETKGPIELVESKTVDNDNANEEGSQYHMEKLRKYQLSRLKYYYAVIEFDRPESANKVYTECDGMEYESSAIKIDLRFIPNDMTFDDQPKEFCDKLPEVNKYQPRFFTTTALQQVKVDLTWDETNPERVELTQKLSSGKVDDIAEADLQNYLASSSGEEEVEDDNCSESETESKADVIDKYKALLENIEKKENSKNEKDVELEISWGIDLKDKTEKLMKQKQNDSQNATPFEKYLEKRKERRKVKRELKKTKSAEYPQDNSDVPSGIDMNDPYFAEEFNTPEFKTNKKSKNHAEQSSEDEIDEQKQAELELLLMNEDKKQHFNLKMIQENDVNKKKKKAKGQLDDNFEVNTADERFSALFTSHHYNIDPTDPHYKKTKAMDALINEKLKRRQENDIEADGNAVKRRKEESTQNNNRRKSELNLLVKSVKRKTKEYKNK